MKLLEVPWPVYSPFFGSLMHCGMQRGCSLRHVLSRCHRVFRFPLSSMSPLGASYVASSHIAKIRRLLRWVRVSRGKRRRRSSCGWRRSHWGCARGCSGCVGSDRAYWDASGQVDGFSSRRGPALPAARLLHFARAFVKPSRGGELRSAWPMAARTRCAS